MRGTKRRQRVVAVLLMSQLALGGCAADGSGGDDAIAALLAVGVGAALGLASSGGDPTVAASVASMMASSVPSVSSGPPTGVDILADALAGRPTPVGGTTMGVAAGTNFDVGGNGIGASATEVASVVSASPEVTNAIRRYGSGAGIPMVCSTRARDVASATLAFIPDDPSLGNLNVRRVILSDPSMNSTLGEMAREIDSATAAQMLYIGRVGMENSLVKGMTHSTSNEIAQRKYIAGRLDNYMVPGSASRGPLGVPLSAFLEFWNFANLHNLSVGVMRCMGENPPVQPLWPTGTRIGS